VLRQIERGRRDELPPEAPPQFVAPAPLESIGGVTVTVNEFRFEGNSLLTAEQLRPAVASFTAHPIDFTGLQNAAIAVANAYRRAGWVVRAYLPAQDVTTGIVTIEIIEARFGAVRFEGQYKRVSTKRLRRIAEAAQAPGDPVNADDLDRSLLLINDLPGVAAVGRLAAGRNDAETDLVLALEDRPLVDGSVIMDDAGARFTGGERVIGTASLEGRAGIGDRADALLLHSQGSDYLRLAYSLPVGSRGWRVGANASRLDYDIVLDDFAALDAHGSSSSTGFEASYPLVRSRLANLYLRIDGDDRRFDNKSVGQTTTHYGVQAGSVGVYGNRFDRLHGGGATNAALSLVKGRVDLAGSPNEALDAVTAHTHGGFTKLRYSASRLQSLTGRISLFASLDGQAAGDNLDSSEKLYLGGSQGVRAYPEDEAGGSSGLLATLEARSRVGRSVDLTAFYDWGRVTLNEDNDFAGAPELNRLELKGAGVSVGWVTRFGLNLKATLARRIGDNPNPTPTGDDQDGSLVKNRFWLQASMPF
jgi:hemolysin activation/secretion protein